MTEDQFQTASIALHVLNLLVLVWLGFLSRRNKQRLQKLDHWNNIALERGTQALNAVADVHKKLNVFHDEMMLKIGLRSPDDETLFVWKTKTDNRVTKLENRVRRGRKAK